MTAARVGLASLAPTVRAISWRPLLGGLAALAVTLAALAATSAPPLSPALVALVLAIVAALVLHALDDPAHALLAALPTSALHRLTHRLAVTTAVVLGAGAAAVAADLGGLGDVHRPPLAGGFAALVATGVLLHVTIATCHPAQAAGAVALPGLWAVLAAVVEPEGAGALAHGWSTHPWPIVLGALVVVVGLDRGR